jgi:DNA adenine methylase
MRTKPILKWVGGKSQLLKPLAELITNKSRTYYEPFLGGGAVFFHFADHYRFRSAVLNDYNSDLINCYEVVRDRLPELLRRLDAIKREPDWNTREYFEAVRAQEPTDPIERAARLIYLNKTAFNGLYRVNRAGKFNVPFGKYKNPTLYHHATMIACSEALQTYATLCTGDYADAVKDAKEGDLVYFDPPYVPVSETSNFTSYSSQFGPDEQQQLATLFRELYDRGVIVVQSNSDAPLVRELYAGFDQHVVGAKRSINSKGDRRGEVNELVIVGKPKDLRIEIPAAPHMTDISPVECTTCGTVYSSSAIVCPSCSFGA